MSASSVSIREIGVDEWREYRSVRLRALREAPHAFQTTLEEAQARTDAAWRERHESLDRGVWLPLAAERNGVFEGTAWGHVADRPGTVEVFQMWVAPELRGQRVGVGFLERIRDWAITKGADRIELGVRAGNQAATNLYRRFGFERVDRDVDPDDSMPMEMDLPAAQRVPVVDFYFGPGSRYSYLAATQIASIEAVTGCRFRWKPVFSGDLIARTGNDPFAPDRRRGQYEADYRRKDAERWARYYSVPYAEPEAEDVDWKQQVLALLAADELGGLRRFAARLFDRNFGRGRPVTDEAQLRQLADDAGLSAESWAHACAGRAVADRAANLLAEAEAEAAGVFGVPAFVVGDELFWGQDRIPLLIAHLQSLRAQARQGILAAE